MVGRRYSRLLAAAAVLVLPVTGMLVRSGPAGAVPPGTPAVLHVGQVTRQDVRPQPGSERDTVVEPDVAVSPLHPDVAVAVAHDGRFANGGAVDISYAWTRDGGARWHHAPVPRLTRAVGGTYDRASDPVVAYGPDGSAYLSALLIDARDCRSGVAVLRSTNGGRTWGAPVMAHSSRSCKYSDDKNWLVVDNSRTSPHRGRIYQFWTPFITARTFSGSPQAVRWSDDLGRTWSHTSYVTAKNQGTQNSQPMILADGTIVDTYYNYGPGQAPDTAPGLRPESPRATLGTPAAINASGSIFAARSTDGGKSWSRPAEVTINGGGYAPGVRCCLFGADIDAQTQLMYVVFNGVGPGGNTDPVELSSSRDGIIWSSPVRVSRGDIPGVQRVNVDVVARRGDVYVSYGTRTRAQDHGGVVQQQLSTSTDRGRYFGEPLSIGPRSVLRYAARAGGYFPGDYIGSAITTGRIYLVWAVSSKPPAWSRSPYHQIIEGATLRP